MLGAELVSVLGDKPTVEHRQALLTRVQYIPNPDQEVFHFALDASGKPYRFKLAAGGERAGKSFSAAMELFSLHFWGDLFWIVGPDYEQARNEFRYVMQALERIGNLEGKPSMPLQGSWSLRTRTGAEIVTKSGKDPETLAGRAPDGILMVEAGQQSYEAYLRCSGRVAERRGWLCINGTFEGSTGWYADLWRAWQNPNNPEGGRSFSLPTWGNRALFPEGEEDPEIQRLKRTFPEDKFNERYAGKPMKPAGLVYSELKHEIHVRMFRYVEAGRLFLPEPGEILIDPSRGITLWIDPGHEGYYVGFGQVDKEREKAYLLDEVFTTGLISEDVIGICQNKLLWKYVDRLVMDIAGKQHHGSQAPVEIWEAQTGLRVHAKKYAVPDEILRVRSSLRVDPVTGEPGFYIAPKCVRFLKEATTLYKYPVDDMGQATSNIPIPKDNHGCTAVAYGLLDAFGHVKGVRKRGYVGSEESTWDR